MLETKTAAFTFVKQGIYYFSRRIPSELSHHYSSKRISYSLRTRSTAVANSRSLRAAQQLDEHWYHLRIRDADLPGKHLLRMNIASASIPTGANQNAPDQVLFWQHDAHFIRGNVPHKGDMLIFNNGMRRNAEGKAEYDQVCMGMLTGAYSNVLEISLPFDKDGKLVSGAEPTIEWGFNTDGKLAFYSPFMSNAQRQPNGNTLSVQACDKRIIEFTHDGELLMDFHVGGPGRMYRIYKYAPDHPGIKALGL